MSTEKKETVSFREVLDKASASAIRGGTAGAVAMGANVACLMWLRTTVCQETLSSWSNSFMFWDKELFEIYLYL